MMILAISIALLEDWVSRGFWFGCALVFSLLILCGLGLPLPEDIPLIVAGAFLITHPSDWVIVGAACWCGIIGGDCILYSLGRRYGMGITRVPIIGKHITAERIEHVQGLFEKYGVGVVAVGRLFAGIRGAMVVTAGTLRFSFVKFIIADGLAAIFSGGFFMIVGWWIKRKFSTEDGRLDPHKIEQFKHLFMLGGLVLAVALLVWVIWRRRTHTTVSEVVGKKLEKTIEKVEKKVEEKKQLRQELQQQSEQKLP